jgi:tRNA (guanine37-N1)-methyltransferase
MRIDVLTIFPELFPPILASSIIGRAAEKGVVKVNLHDLRDWSGDPKHHKVDDRPYGGGPGMVMKPEPFFDAVDAISQKEGQGQKPWVVLLSPGGTPLTQQKARELSSRPWLALLCGHYEGIDERVRQGLADEELSIGDYVLTCGELPAMVLIDSVVRLIPGSLGDDQSARDESFSLNLLEYPQYTRPADYRGMRVPDVLLSGDDGKIAQWRKLQSLRKTKTQRPDLID